MEIIATSASAWSPVTHQARDGDVDMKLVREGELLPGVGYTALLIRYNEGQSTFTAPRHHHDFEQIRLTLSGVQDFGQGQVSDNGWVAYFPAGAFYGPERIEGASILLIQWSGHWVTREQNDQTIAQLRETGEFHDGIYTYLGADGKKHNKDGLNAVWEHVHGRPSVFPTPKYPSPILMNPDAFAWSRADDVLSRKVLGRFTERDLTISKIRWDADGSFEFPADRTACLFTLEGDVTVNASAYERHTAIWSDVGETGSVVAKRGTQAMYFGFPPIDDRLASLN